MKTDNQYENKQTDKKKLGNQEEIDRQQQLEE